MKKWIDYLNADVYARLAGCCVNKEDLPQLVNTRWLYLRDRGKDKEGFTKEDALVQVLELLDSNGQSHVADLTLAEYDELKS